MKYGRSAGDSEQGGALWDASEESRALPEPPTFRIDDADDLPLPVPVPVAKESPDPTGSPDSTPPPEAPPPPAVAIVSRNLPGVTRRGVDTEAPAPPRRPALTVPGWFAFVAWVMFWVGAALADASRPGFRVVTGLDNMFGVVRGFGGDSRLAGVAGVLFVFASAFGLLGVIAALVSPKRHVPWLALLALIAATIALVFYRP